MKLFVDASALIAILAHEADRGEFVDRIEEADAIYSCIAHWETANALSRIDRTLDPQAAGSEVTDLGRLYDIGMVEMGDTEAAIAVAAFARYGQGRHPAKLNMGDCFAYACAKTNNARLLYKGDDFARTDLA